jgi:hypothetical protein
MRASQALELWPGVWLAGFTSRTIYDRRHWVFYLARIQAAYESQCEIWQAMTVRSRNAKAAHRHFLGDLFQPNSPIPCGSERFKPSCYVRPEHHTHRLYPADRSWQKDIDYVHAVNRRRSPMLVADSSLTFLWEEPMIFLERDHCRDYFKRPSLASLLGELQEAV